MPLQPVDPTLQAADHAIQTADLALQAADHAPPTTDKAKQATCKHVFDDGPRKGQVCGARYADSSGLKKHDDAKHKKIKHVCNHILADGLRKGEKCGITCTRPNDLKRHVDAKHNNITHDCKHVFKDGPRKGDTCGKLFGEKKQLDSHMIDHTGIFPLHCEFLKEDGTVCGEGCKTSAHLDYHMIDHTGIYPFNCELLKESGSVCGKGCKTSHDMNVHIMYNHTDKDSQEYKDFREIDNQRAQEKRTKDNKEHAASIEQNGGMPSEFGHIEGVSRDEEITSHVGRIMENPAGSLRGPIGAMTVTKWTGRHGNESLRHVFMNHAGKRFAVYFFITRRKIKPGVEEKCPESFAFLHEVKRNSLWRIKDKEDLRRFTYTEAGSVSETYLLAISGNPRDITDQEGAAQRYIEKLEMPHGVRLHIQAGAGSRRVGSETVPEKKDRANGITHIYSLAMTLVEIHDPVFDDEADPNDPTPTIPRLLSATVIGRNKKGFPKTFEIEVRGHKKPHRNTISVQNDKNERKRLKKLSNVADKVRHTGRESVSDQDTNQDCVQEPPTKKQKTAATQLVP
ncbi:hypothetical protein T484DRAFT_1747631 [Baffinella frigidus]|nr:hypothetical protein T484DRAFT_1747631 [Cryptophyta sp. CCMP2293]